MIGKRARILAATASIGAIFVSLAPVSASAQADEARIRKIESEVRALQRKVFPGGDGRFFDEQTTGTSTAPATDKTLPPSTTALTDILARLDAMEGQLARLTSQVETNTNAIAALNRVLTQYHPEAAAALAPPSSGGAASSTGAATSPMAVPIPASTPTTTSPAPSAAVAPPKPAATTPAPKPAAPSAQRLAAVQAIAKPSTNDPGDDEYTYGFRLWEAKFYPEAEQQLRLYVDKYPKHSKISFGRNLLGRAYLDDGKPAEAAPWFLKNYQTDKQGDRAGDSLLYLAESMIAQKDTSRACIALAEFGDTYPALATGRLREQYEADRRKVTCK
jgi:TolA-binding protein